ncbi:MAG: YqaJ viral recombinase family protein [Firmicutes bacterium]|nr:YqaJ viral recombinase family protein [Bacillota bacterium]
MAIESERKIWLEERKKGIGASDAAAIIGKNHYKTNVQLWEEKTGLRQTEDISEKPYVKYGTEAEKYLRSLFQLDFPEYEVNYDQYGRIANLKKYPFLFATLDGELTEKQTGRKGILEIKTTEIINSIQLLKWKNRIPDNYYIQVLHQLLVTGYDFAIVKAQLKFSYDGVRLETRHYTIERNEVIKDMEYLLKKEIAFWECVTEKRKPNLILPDI